MRGKASDFRVDDHEVTFQWRTPDEFEFIRIERDAIDKAQKRSLNRAEAVALVRERSDLLAAAQAVAWEKSPPAAKLHMTMAAARLLARDI